MADTSQRPRVGAMQIMRERPGSMFFDSWAVCPHPEHNREGQPPSERDDTVWYEFASSRFRCRDGHTFDERYALWEVQGR